MTHGTRDNHEEIPLPILAIYSTYSILASDK